MIKNLVLAGILAATLVSTSGMSADSAVASNDALAYLNIDIENNPGWVAGLKGGYQWKLFRKAGVRFGGTVGGTDFVHNVSRNITKSGAAGTVTLGYNFGNRIPLTIGVAFGQGPAGKLRTYSAFTAGGTRYRTETYQRVNIYTFDFSADYDFRNCSRWIPFIGLTGGLGFVSQHGNGHMIAPDGTEYGSGYEKRKRVNFIVGARRHQMEIERMRHFLALWFVFLFGQSQVQELRFRWPGRCVD